MPFDDTLFLKNVDVLSFFTEDQLQHVTAVIEHKTYNQGQTIMFQGELTNNFFVIKKGKAVVVSKTGKEKTQLAELKTGDFFGEMSLLESTSATATIKSSEDGTEVLMIPHEAFHFLLKTHPLLESTIRQRISTRKQQRLDNLAKKGPNPS